ncbi:MAG TPA: hypothetical protein VHW46_14530 [Terracidiphilus sp.]|jgi:hypothetical protein|nr:hypothetical protein [Terracidiphilus sp.]
MFQDSAEERRRLDAVYRAKIDEELLILSEEFADLTEIAQQALQAEMKRRGLSADDGVGPAAVPHDRTGGQDPITAHDANLPDDPEAEAAFTWKEELCECETEQQAVQLAEVLRRAGIDRWLQRQGGGYPRILVAADQLEQARSFALQPIPQDIVDAANDSASTAEFEAPHCPTCGAPDPVLLAVDPANEWECDACEHTWTESAADGASQT